VITRCITRADVSARRWLSGSCQAAVVAWSPESILSQDFCAGQGDRVRRDVNPTAGGGVEDIRLS